MTLLAVASIVLVLDGQLVLRRGQTPPPGRIVSVTTEGVAVEDDAGVRTLVGWDRVRSINGEFEQQGRAFEDIADRAWRARVRMERGDIAAAEPLLEELAREYVGREGPTAEMVWAGLLNARLQRGAQIAAVQPWLQLLATDADLEGPTDDSGQPIVDARTGLAPALPPLWVDWPAVQAFAANDLDSADPATSQGRLAHLYRAAARIEAGWDNDQILADRRPGSSTGDARFARGVELVELIVLARVGDRDERALARGRLRQRLTPDAPRWEQAWVRCAIGRSLTHETDPDLQRRGVVQLLYLPATLADAHPYLAGLALGEAVVTMDELEDAPAADRLHLQLIERYANHPVMDWQRIRDRTPPR